MQAAEINQPQVGDCGYVALYKGKKIGIWAKSSYDAQQQAAKHFKARKAYQVEVYLAVSSDQNPVVHTFVD